MLSFLYKVKPSIMNFGVKSFTSLSQPINTAIWKKMNFDEKVNLALTDDNPDQADIAYYKGLGLKKLGKEFFEEAIFTFNKAIKLDKSYQDSSEKQIMDIYKKMEKVSTHNNSTMALTTNVEWSKMLEDIEKTCSFSKTIKYNANVRKKSVEKVIKNAERFMVDIYGSALKEGQNRFKNYEFSNALVIFDKIIENISELNVQSRALNKVLSEAYVQGGIVLYKGGIKDNEKAFEYFKIATDLNPKNKLAKEKVSEMRYERGEYRLV